MPTFLRRRTASRRPRPARVWRGLESLEARYLMAAVPLGAAPTDTAEYMLGDVTVKVVFLESAAGNPQNNENWDAAAIARVKGTIERGLQWWEDTLHQYYPGAYLDFHVDFSQADNPFTVAYEPIKRTSDDTRYFVDEFLTSKGYAGGGPDAIYPYNNQLRIDTQSNWAFTIFVVNSDQDAVATGSGSFALGGAFSQSFAYPGGRYVVTLSDRPEWIIAHEAGHMFYALDEYTAGDPYSALRGYYNQQNTNGKNGAPSPFTQQDSLMSSGFPQQNSYFNHTLPVSTRANIGWRDSDLDGLIDIVDVNHTLKGYGYRDALTGNYRFVGESQVRALPNLNSVGNKNDITVNRIRVAEYSLDNGATWQVAANYDTYSADLDLTIPLAGAAQIKIRTRDTTTGVASDLFSAPTDRMSSTTQPGINGVVFNDSNSNGVWDAGEASLAGRSVYLVNQAGQAVSGPIVLDPSNYAPDAEINKAIPQVTLSLIVNGLSAGDILARDTAATGTTQRTFGSQVGDDYSSFFSSNKSLRMKFNVPVRQISLDAISLLSGTSYGRLDAYDANGVLLARYTTGPLGLGQSETMTVSSLSADIAYALAFGHARGNIGLDRLTMGSAVSTTTNAQGAFSLPNLAAGTYYVQSVAPTDWAATTPANGRLQVSVTGGQSVANVNFGQHLTTLRWHNSTNPFDVNNDQKVTPLDALLVINYLNAVGPQTLTDPPSGEGPPRFIDINGDGSLSPLDALQVIIYLNSGGGSGEAYLTNSGTAGTGDAGGAAVASQGELTVNAFAEAVTGSVATAAAPSLPSGLFEVSILNGAQSLSLNGAQSLSPAPTNGSALRSMSNSDSAPRLAPLVARQINDAATDAWRFGATPGRRPGNVVTENWEAPWKRKPSSPSTNGQMQAAAAAYEADNLIDEATYARLAADVAAARTRQEVTRLRATKTVHETPEAAIETPRTDDQTPPTNSED
jgi:hypothetical protein